MDSDSNEENIATESMHRIQDLGMIHKFNIFQSKQHPSMDQCNYRFGSMDKSQSTIVPDQALESDRTQPLNGEPTVLTNDCDTSETMSPSLQAYHRQHELNRKITNLSLNNCI